MATSLETGSLVLTNFNLNLPRASAWPPGQHNSRRMSAFQYAPTAVYFAELSQGILFPSSIMLHLCFIYEHSEIVPRFPEIISENSQPLRNIPSGLPFMTLSA